MRAWIVAVAMLCSAQFSFAEEPDTKPRLTPYEWSKPADAEKGGGEDTRTPKARKRLVVPKRTDAESDATFRALLRKGKASEIAARAVALESRTNLLFSFEKMALRDAVRSPKGAQAFARALYQLVYGGGEVSRRFDRWVDALAGLPRRQTRVLTWPLATVFGFLAVPELHFFVKPRVTKIAAADYGFPRCATRPGRRGRRTRGSSRWRRRSSAISPTFPRAT